MSLRRNKSATAATAATAVTAPSSDALDWLIKLNNLPYQEVMDLLYGGILPLDWPTLQKNYVTIDARSIDPRNVEVLVESMKAEGFMKLVLCLSFFFLLDINNNIKVFRNISWLV